MMRKKWISVGATALVLTGALAPVTALAQSEVALERIEARAQNMPLRSLAATVERGRGADFRPGPPREVLNFRGEGLPRLDDGGETNASATQDFTGSGATLVGSGFPGMSNADNGQVLGYIVAPPDTDGQVGNNFYVQMINSLTAVYDLAGKPLLGPFPSNQIWDGQGGNCEPNNQGDPIVLYDDQADRWLISQFAFPDSFNSFSQCVAISQSGDPTGAWNRYEFSFDGIGFNDYPKHGIVSDSITMTANLFVKRGGGPFAQFSFGGTFLGVMDKAAMYAGDPASLIGFNIGTGEFGFVAGDLDGPGTAPALFATAMSNLYDFDIWQIDVDWATENASAGPIASIPISSFDFDLCSASREACIPQPGNGPALEAIADRLMHRLQIRDFGAYRTMLATHTVDVDGTGRAGIRWYEMRESNGNWSLYQEGTYGPNDGEHRWIPSAAMNAAGDIGIGFLVASEDTFVSTAVAGQSKASSGTGLLDSAEVICAFGSGVQEDTGRSGDYASTSVDESDGSFWHTNEVFVTTGQFAWSTFVCDFEVGDGGGTGNTPPTASFTRSCDGLTCSFDANDSTDDSGIVSYDWDFGDGTTATGVTASRTYQAGGDYIVVLTVADGEGAKDTASVEFTVTDPNVNQPPTASFTSSCTDLDCSFDASGSTDDSGIVSYAWDFGDGETGSGVTASNTFAAAGTYTVTLTVTDDDDATDTFTENVTVTEPAAISLSATGTKVRGRHVVDLSWSGATSTDVDVYRDGSVITTTANDGAYTDNTGNNGGATYVYQVCEAGTGTCSAEVSVVF